MSSLPIDPLLPAIVAALDDHSRLVLRAAPGAGKTTRVPAALLDAGLAGTKQVLVLEPRRIAARAAADFVARERGGAVGGEVGYRVRFEQKGDASTRLWFLTEGVLGRQLARDPFLEQAGVIVLDEFHERHLQGDIALAVVRELQATVRPDLKLVVMSATLDTARLSEFLGDCPILTSEGRAFPVAVEYQPAADDRPLPARVVSAWRRIVEGGDRGDVLVFLPGAAEIRRITESLQPLADAAGCDVVPLHGNLTLDAQHRVLQRGARPKVVLATNVAETALTVEGVTAVIDSGLARVARLDAKHGINALRLVPISRAAADQRAGRAGRLAPGRCIRLWSEGEHTGRKAHEVPEILRLDLSATVLELRAWGLRDARSFAWLDPPPAAALSHAERLLVQLGAVDAMSGELTEVGRRLLALSAPPRLARIVIEAAGQGQGAMGALLAALASERDISVAARGIARGPSAAMASASSDLLQRVELFLDAARSGFDAGRCRALGLDHRSVHAVERARRQLCQALRVPDGMPRQIDEHLLLRCILVGFPDRVVRRRAAGSARGVMAGGVGVVLADTSVVRDAELFIAVDVDAAARRSHAEALVRVASAIEERWLTQLFPGAVAEHTELTFDPTRRRVVACTQRRYEDVVLAARDHIDVDRLAAGEVLATHARAGALIPCSAAEESLLDRIRFLQQWMPELDWPADAGSLRREVVAGLCAGCVTLSEVEAQDIESHVRRALTPAQRRALEHDAPPVYVLPSGRSVAVRYEPTRPPAVAARIQELFGLTATPKFAGGRVPLIIEILAPNQRPVQITDDLQSFWQRTYPEVRKQLRGRYPKHQWPEDPMVATPTSRMGRPR